MHCRGCGNELKKYFRFCPNCGKDVHYVPCSLKEPQLPVPCPPVPQTGVKVHPAVDFIDRTLHPEVSDDELDA